MALGSSNVTTNLVSSVTGLNNKGYMLFSDYKQADSKNAAMGLSNLANKLQEAAKTTTAKTNTTGFTSYLFDDDSLKKFATKGNYIPIKVQFNPKTISFIGQSGEVRSKSVGGESEGMFNQTDVPVETILKMELIFDDTNVMDAFMINSNLLSLAGAADTATQYTRAVLDMEYSVRDVSELFVSAMVNGFSRQVGFVWNKIIFWGEMTSVNVQYTMFNKKGNPIRSVVALQIRQDKNKGETAYATEKNWETAFENMFKVKKTNTAIGINNKASNIFNLN